MEVTVRLKFTTPCLGSVRNEIKDSFLRSPEGGILLLQSWWRAVLAFGANAVNRHHKEINKIHVDPVIKGSVKTFKRFYTAVSFKEHEAFLPGDEIEVKFCLPSSLTIAQFKELLEVAGTYIGISPYRGNGDYGRFSVSDISYGSNYTSQREPNSDTPPNS